MLTPSSLPTCTHGKPKLPTLFNSRSKLSFQFLPKAFRILELESRKNGLKVNASQKLEDKNVPETGTQWGKVSAVLFDMDGVLCNSEESSRKAAVDVFTEMGVQVTVEDFVPFMGMGKFFFFFFLNFLIITFFLFIIFEFSWGKVSLPICLYVFVFSLLDFLLRV